MLSVFLEVVVVELESCQVSSGLLWIPVAGSRIHRTHARACSVKGFPNLTSLHLLHSLSPHLHTTFAIIVFINLPSTPSFSCSHTPPSTFPAQQYRPVASQRRYQTAKADVAYCQATGRVVDTRSEALAAEASLEVNGSCLLPHLRGQ